MAQNIRRIRKKFSRPGDEASGICELLRLSISHIKLGTY
jgi:hypothetical protein